VTLSASASQGDYVGEVEEELSTAVSFTGSGTVTHVAVSEGLTVSKGQLIAGLAPTQYKNALTAAEAMVRQARDVEARLR